MAYSYLENLKGCVPNLNVAVKLSKLLNCLSMKTGSKELCVKTGIVCTFTWMYIIGISREIIPFELAVKLYFYIVVRIGIVSSCHIAGLSITDCLLGRGVRVQNF